MSALKERLDKQLHEQSPITPYLEKFEKLTGLKRLYLVIGVGSLFSIYLVFGYGAELLCNVIGYIYPAYASIKALETFNKDDDTKWLTYWVVFALFSVCEFFSDIFLSWFPFYWLAKCAFLLWCFVPFQNNGSDQIYQKIIRPFFIKHQGSIDQTLKNAAGAAGKAFQDVKKAAGDAIGDAVAHKLTAEKDD